MTSRAMDCRLRMVAEDREPRKKKGKVEEEEGEMVEEEKKRGKEKKTKSKGKSDLAVDKNLEALQC